MIAAVGAEIPVTMVPISAPVVRTSTPEASGKDTELAACMRKRASRQAAELRPYLTAPRCAVLGATVGGMAVAALVVAIIAVVVAVFAAAYARTQALAAKGSLAIEQARHEAEQAPRFDADITSGHDPELRLRLLPGQLPMTGVGLRIVQGAAGEFDCPGYCRIDGGGGTGTRAANECCSLARKRPGR